MALGSIPASKLSMQYARLPQAEAGQNRKLLAKEKKDWHRPSYLSLGEGRKFGHADYLGFLWGMEWAQVTDDLIGTE